MGRRGIVMYDQHSYLAEAPGTENHKMPHLENTTIDVPVLTPSLYSPRKVALFADL